MPAEMSPRRGGVAGAASQKKNSGLYNMQVYIDCSDYLRYRGENKTVQTNVVSCLLRPRAGSLQETSGRRELGILGGSVPSTQAEVMSHWSRG